MHNRGRISKPSSSSRTRTDSTSQESTSTQKSRAEQSPSPAPKTRRQPTQSAATPAKTMVTRSMSVQQPSPKSKPSKAAIPLEKTRQELVRISPNEAFRLSESEEISHTERNIIDTPEGKRRERITREDIPGKRRKTKPQGQKRPREEPTASLRQEPPSKRQKTGEKSSEEETISYDTIPEGMSTEDQPSFDFGGVGLGFDLDTAPAPVPAQQRTNNIQRQANAAQKELSATDKKIENLKAQLALAQAAAQAQGTQAARLNRQIQELEEELVDTRTRSKEKAKRKYKEGFETGRSEINEILLNELNELKETSEKDVENLTAKIRKKDETITQLEKKLSTEANTNQQINDNLNQQILDLQKEKQSLQEQIQKEKQALQAKIDEYAQKINEAKQKQQKEEARIKQDYLQQGEAIGKQRAQNQATQEAQTIIEKQRAQHAEQIAQLEKQLNIEEKRKQTLQDELSDLKAQLAQAEGKERQNAQTISNLNKDLANAEKDIKTKEIAIENKKSKIKSLTQAKTKLEATTKGLAQQLKQAQIDLDKEKKKPDPLNNKEIEKRDLIIKGLKTQIKHNQTELEKIKAELQKKEKELETAKKIITELKIKVGRLKSKIGKLKTTLQKTHKKRHLERSAFSGLATSLAMLAATRTVQAGIRSLGGALTHHYPALAPVLNTTIGTALEYPKAVALVGGLAVAGIVHLTNRSAMDLTHASEEDF